MSLERKLSYYITKSKDLDLNNCTKKIKIAILGSFTLNGLEETLRVKCFESNIDCKTFVSGYNQYNQDILNNNSQLYAYSPDVAFLILDVRSMLGKHYFSSHAISTDERKDLIQKILDKILQLIKGFTENSNAKFIISNFSIPTYSPNGIFENKIEYGIQKMVSDLNNKLVDNIRNNSSVYLYDFNGLVTKHGEKNIFDFRQYFFGDIKVSIDYIPFLANELMGYVKAILGLNKKCIVLDLDNTLWGGIVGEDGFEGIKLGDDPIGRSYVEFQHYLLGLHQRGIILAINSKNNVEDAMKVIKEHPNMILREEHFACLKINWDDKISNMKQIAEELNIGVDSMVFFDDDPVNREYFKSNLPEVLTVNLPKDPSQYPDILLSMNDFDVLKITDEDKKRGKMYLQQRKRIELGKKVSNVKDFLKQLNIKVKIKKANDFTIPRISQLTLKTNQFNLTTQRYQEEEIRKFSQNKDKLVGCAQVEDKFGDNGITGVYIINKNNNKEWIIDTFLLSCRVMGRGIEEGILNNIIEKAKNEGIQTIKGRYIPTKKNKPAENFLKDFGFKNDGDFWSYNITSSVKKPEHLEVINE